jgi:hypothetical protein
MMLNLLKKMGIDLGSLLIAFTITLGVKASLRIAIYLGLATASVPKNLRFHNARKNPTREDSTTSRRF